PAPVSASWSMSLSGLPFQYASMKVMSDSTEGLTQPGIVRLQLPTGPIGAPPHHVLPDWIAGRGMSPPRSADRTIAAPLVPCSRLADTSAPPVSCLGGNP